MRKILFVSALPAELKIIKQEIKKLNSKKIEFSFLAWGMGNYNMIFNLTKFLEKNNNIDFIVNIWVCGYSLPLSQPFPPREKGAEVPKVIQAWRIKNLSDSKEKIIPNFIDFTEIESIACSEKIIYDKNKLEEEDFVDMESYWFEMVAEKYNIARLILKVPVDKIWEETKNFDFDKAKKFLKENIDYEKLVEKIWGFLDTSFQPSTLEERELYFKKLNLTASQKVIFERLYNKYLVLVWEDFDSYLEKFLDNFKEKKLQKSDVKDFLKKLDVFLANK